MEGTYGVDWRAQLRAAEEALVADPLDEDEEDEVDAADPVGQAAAQGSEMQTPQEVPAAIASALVAVGDARSIVSDFTQASWAVKPEEELRALLNQDFDPSSETLQQYEARLFRSIAVLEARGVTLTDVELEHPIIKSRYIMDTAGMTDPEAARFLRGVLGRLLEEGDVGPMVDARVEILLDLLRAKSATGRVSPLCTRLFTTPSQGDGGRVSPPRRNTRDVPLGSPVREATPSEAVSADSQLAEAIRAQTEAMTKQSQATEAALVALAVNPKLSSTIRVNTTCKFPILGDDDKDPDLWKEEFEGILAMANDGRGMMAQEKLITLEQCVKQSRAEVFHVVKRAKRASGEWVSSPDLCYADIMDRLLEFKDSLVQKQTKLDREWSADMPKGKLSARQFQPVFEKLASALDRVGLGKTDRELYLGYLRRLPPHMRSSVMMHRDAYEDAENKVQLRAPTTWKEAHRVVLDLEENQSNSQAMVAPVQPVLPGSSSEGGEWENKGSKKESKKALQEMLAAFSGGGLPEHLRGMCFKARDNPHGKCDVPNCQYDHDPRRISEARKLKEAQPRKVAVAKAVAKTAVRMVKAVAEEVPIIKVGIPRKRARKSASTSSGALALVDRNTGIAIARRLSARCSKPC